MVRLKFEAYSLYKGYSEGRRENLPTLLGGGASFFPPWTGIFGQALLTDRNFEAII